MGSRPSKTLAAALACAALLLPTLGACGGGGGGEDAEVRAAATKFFDALHARDFKTVCSLFSETVLRTIPKATSGGCEKILNKVERTQTDAVVKIGDARIRENRATVAATVSRPGQPEGNLEVLMIKEGGQWKVASRI